MILELGFVLAVISAGAMMEIQLPWLGLSCMVLAGAAAVTIAAKSAP